MAQIQITDDRFVQKYQVQGPDGRVQWTYWTLISAENHARSADDAVVVPVKFSAIYPYAQIEVAQ